MKLNNLYDSRISFGLRPSNNFPYEAYRRKVKSYTPEAVKEIVARKVFCLALILGVISSALLYWWNKVADPNYVFNVIILILPLVFWFLISEFAYFRVLFSKLNNKQKIEAKNLKKQDSFVGKVILIVFIAFAAVLIIGIFSEFYYK